MTDFVKIRAKSISFVKGEQVDGGLICEIKTGKQGMSLKLENRQNALDWLANFFDLNPQHRHRTQFDKAKLEIEKDRLELDRQRLNGPSPEKIEDDGFLDALKGAVGTAWDEEGVTDG
jgi:phage terminase small subunit